VRSRHLAQQDGCDRLGVVRGLGEDYTDVILRIAAEGG